MPRFPVLPQRRSAPAAYSSTPRAQAAHFGAGIGRNLAELGSEAVGLGLVIEERQERQIKQQMSRFDLELAKQRAASDAQAPPEEARDARIERHRSIFDAGAEKVLQGYEGQGLQGRLREGIELRRESWNRRLLEGEAQKRLGESLQDARGLVQHWAGRVAVDANEFSTASRELLGDEVAGETGLLAGLGLRPEALVAWRGHALRHLLEAQIKSDPAGLRAELEAGRWQKDLPEDFQKSLLEDAEDALARHRAAEELKHSQTRGGKTLSLSQGIAAGTAGLADIRRAEETGALSSTQAEALRGEVEQAEIALQAQQIAGDELAISLSSGVGFDLGNPQNRQAADDFYEKTFSEAVREGASQEVLAQVVSAVARTGYLPPRLVRDATGLLLGSDETRQIQGAELYAGLREAVPEVIALAFDPETRARGGVLKRWIDMGLEPGDALQRAEMEWPGDGGVQIQDADELEVLKRDLGSFFTAAQSDHHVERILTQLERNYLEDLGKGLTPRQARHQVQRDVGRVMRKLTLQKDSQREEPGAPDDGRSPLLIPTGATSEAFKQGFRGLGGQGGARPRHPLYGPFHPSDDKLAEAATQELQRGAQSVIDSLSGLYDIYNTYVSEVRASSFPGYAAYFFNNAMVSIGDGGDHLSYILDEHERNGTRSLGFVHPEHGAMIVRQLYDISTESFRNLDITFRDPETGEYITERYPNSRFVVQLDDTRDVRSFERDPALPDIISPGEGAAASGHTRATPSDQHRPTVLPGRPFDPLPVPELPPSEPGRGRELVPDHTGGNQLEHGPLMELAPGFPAQEQEPQIYISPDEREELRKYQALLQANASDDDEVKLPAGLTEADLKPAKQGRDQPVMSSKGDVWSAKSGLTAIKNLEVHYRDHSKDFAHVTSPMEYALAAKKFLDNPPEGVQAKIRENGDILLYDPVSHTFAVRDVNGVPRTFFKPEPPKKYWDEQ